MNRSLNRRRAERRVIARHRRISALLRTGRRTRRVARALHNDFDYACQFWWGDRSPERNDPDNRNFGGDPSGLDERRCLVCRPYTCAAEEQNLTPSPPEPRTLLR